MPFQESPIWKTIEGHENYLVSNTGQIMSKSRHLYDKERGVYLRTIPSKILNAFLDVHYLRVNLYNDGKRYTITVHRLVALAFVDGYFEGACVNHIDGNKLNNNADNLEWCSWQGNAYHAYHTGLMGTPVGGGGRRRKKIKRPQSIEVIDTKTGEVFPTIQAAAKYVNIKTTSLRKMLSAPIYNKTSLQIKKGRYVKK